jgi:IS605 OrfB family transposase
LDHNCGVGRHIINAANLQTGEVINLGKCGPNDRKMYFKKRQKQKVKGHKEKRKMKDLDHKISRTIVNYALKHKLRIVVENLKGIRNNARKGKGSKTKNRFVNSWSFYRLQQFIEYKSKEHGIPFEKINPHYTSQECS